MAPSFRSRPPSILFAATARWPFAARLAMRFRDLGARISAICPPDHPLHFVHGLDRIYPCRTLAPQRSLQRAIELSQADFVIPLDDLATWQLHKLADEIPALTPTIIRSIGLSEHFPLIRSRARFLALASSLGIATPATVPVESIQQAAALARSWSLPVVIKKNGTNNGSGVAIASTPEAVVEACKRLTAPQSLLTSFKRRIINGETHAFLRTGALTGDSLSESGISCQAFVPGVPANAMYACSQGKVLAAFQVRSVWTLHATGTSLVVDRIHDPRILDAGIKLAAALSLSGFFGLDFLLRADDGEPLLIEINPRATQLGHLPLDRLESGYSTLAGALWSAWTGNPEPPLASPEVPERIIFFPPASILPANHPTLASAWLDIPQNEPALLRELNRRPWHDRRLLSRIYDAFRPHQPFQPVVHDAPPFQTRLERDVNPQLRREWDADRSAGAKEVPQTAGRH